MRIGLIGDGAWGRHHAKAISYSDRMMVNLKQLHVRVKIPQCSQKKNIQA